MSGIAAVFHSDGQQASAEEIAAITAAMPHRAVDAMAHWRRASMALGHGAFHTCAEDGAVQQPLADDDLQLAIAMDGFVANHADLRRELLVHGAGLRSAADAELVLHAYRLWEGECLARIDGEFAFVVFDIARRRLFAACDHMGLRQLHYHWDGKTLVAATDIAGVVAALPETPPPNLPYLAEHVANGWYSAAETPWRGVLRLPAAHRLTLEGGALRLREYWRLPTQVTIRHTSDADFAAHYLSVLSESVTACARTDRPLACDVSGGLDSSAIFCLADRLAKDGRLPAPDLHGFTLRAPPGTPADEAQYVRAVERHTGRVIEAVDLFCPDLAWFTRQGAQDRRLPFLPNTVMLRDIAAAAAKGCRVNLVGQGGDQWLDGHPHHIRQALHMRDWRALGRNLCADWHGMGAGWTVRQMVRQSLTACLPDRLRSNLLALIDTAGGFEQGTRPDLLSPAMRAALAERRRRYRAAIAGSSADDRLKLAKLKFPFAQLVYDMMNLQTSQAGIENRHPMLSRKFIEFSAATPEHIRWRGGTTKYVHRLALGGILPAEIALRESKAHFSQTFHCHLAKIEQFCGQVLDSDEYRQVICVEALRTEFTNAHNSAIDQMPIWSLWGSYAVAAFLQSRVITREEVA